MLLPLSQITAPVARIAVPLLSRLQDDHARYRTAFLQMLQAIHLAAIPGMVCAIALPDQVIMTLFGAKWAAVAPIFFWLAIAGLPSFAGSASGWLFTSQARTAGLLRNELFSAFLFITSFLVGLPYGAVGVARAYALMTIFVQEPMLWWNSTRQGPVNLRDMMKTLYPFAFSGFCAFVILHLCKMHYDFQGVAGLIIGAVISYTTFLATLPILPEGRRILGNALHLRTLLRRQI